MHLRPRPWFADHAPPPPNMAVAIANLAMAFTTARPERSAPFVRHPCHDAVGDFSEASGT